MLQEYRHKFLSYNDDIQGTAAVVVAAVLGGIRLQKPGYMALLELACILFVSLAKEEHDSFVPADAPGCKELIKELRKTRFLFFGAGSANLGSAEAELGCEVRKLQHASAKAH